MHASRKPIHEYLTRTHYSYTCSLRTVIVGRGSITEISISHQAFQFKIFEKVFLTFRKISPFLCFWPNFYFFPKFFHPSQFIMTPNLKFSKMFNYEAPSSTYIHIYTPNFIHSHFVYAFIFMFTIIMILLFIIYVIL